MVRGLRITGRSLACRPHDVVALFDQAKEMCRVCRSSEVRPVGILQLRDLAHGFEGVLVVAEGESAHDYVRLVACLCFVGVELGMRDLWAGRCALGERRACVGSVSVNSRRVDGCSFL